MSRTLDGVLVFAHPVTSSLWFKCVRCKARLPREEVKEHVCPEETIQCSHRNCLEVTRSSGEKPFKRWTASLRTPKSSDYFKTEVVGSFHDPIWHVPLPESTFSLYLCSKDTRVEEAPSGSQLLWLPTVKAACVHLVRGEDGCTTVSAKGSVSLWEEGSPAPLPVASEPVLIKRERSLKIKIEELEIHYRTEGDDDLGEMWPGRSGARVDQDSVRYMACMGVALLHEYCTAGNRHSGQLHDALRAKMDPALANSGWQPNANSGWQPNAKRYEGVHHVVKFLCAAGALPDILSVDEGDERGPYVVNWCAVLCMAAARTYYEGFGVTKASLLGTGAWWGVQWLASDYLACRRGRHSAFFMIFEANFDVISLRVLERERKQTSLTERELMAFSLTDCSRDLLPKGERVVLRRDPKGDFMGVLTLPRTEEAGSIQNTGGIWLLHCADFMQTRLRLNGVSLARNRDWPQRVLHDGDSLIVGSKHSKQYTLTFSRPRDLWRTGPDTSRCDHLLHALTAQGDGLKDRDSVAANKMDEMEKRLSVDERVALSHLAYAMMLSPTNPEMYACWHRRDLPSQLMHKCRNQAFRHCMWAAKNEESHLTSDEWIRSMVTGLIWATLGMWKEHFSLD